MTASATDVFVWGGWIVEGGVRNSEAPPSSPLRMSVSADVLKRNSVMDLEKSRRRDADILFLIFWFVLVSMGAFAWLIAAGEINLS